MKIPLFIFLLIILTANVAYPQEIKDNENLQQPIQEEDNETTPSPPGGEGVVTDEPHMPPRDIKEHENPSPLGGEGFSDEKESQNKETPVPEETGISGDTEEATDTGEKQVPPSDDIEKEQVYTLAAELTPIFQVIDLDTGSSKAGEFRILKEGSYIDNLLLYYGTQNQEFMSEVVKIAPLTNLMEDGYGVVNYRRFGLLDAGISLNKFPHDYANDAKTIFHLDNPYTYSVANTATEASPFDISTQRDNNSIGVKFTPGDKLIISTSVSVEERSGRRPLTVESFAKLDDTTTAIDETATTIIEIAEPLDYTTTTIDLGMEYVDDTVNIQLNNNLQVFSNNLPDEVLWENPYQPDTYGKIKTADDYTVHTLSIRPSIRLTEGTRLINNLSYSNVTSSITLAPFSNMPDVDVAEFSRDILESDVRSLTFSSILTVRPLSELRLNIKYRYNTYENDTPEIENTPPYVMIDGRSTEYTRIPRYMSYNTKSMELDGTWDLTNLLSINAGIENKDTSRSQREVEKENQRIYSMSIHSRMSNNLYGRVGYKHTRRRGDYDFTYYNESYDPESSVSQHPLMRSFDLSVLDSNTVTATIDYSPTDFLSLGSTLSFAGNKHPGVIIGRRQSSDKSASVYAQYLLFTNLLLYSNYFYEHSEINANYTWTFDTLLQDFYSPDVDPYSNFIEPFTETIKDKTNVYNIGFSHDIGDRLSISANYSKYDSEGTSTNLPTVSSATDIYELKASYKAFREFYSTSYLPVMFKDMKVDVGYYVESYRRKDYALDNFPDPVDAVDVDNPEDIFLGIREPDYRLNIFSISISFYF